MWQALYMGVVENEQNAARNDLRKAAKKIAEGQAELRLAVARAGAAKLAQVEIAELGGVSRPTVSGWLKDGQAGDAQ